MTAAAPSPALANAFRDEAVTVLANMTMSAWEAAAMNGEAKISDIHRDRLAAIYLRQSSMAQVREHTESTTRQYGLAEEAVRLGGPAPTVVIDTDLGVSGRWGAARPGSIQLVRGSVPARSGRSSGSRSPGWPAPTPRSPG